MREAGIGDVGGLTWTKRRGPVEQAERVGLRARREEGDAELVHDVGLLGRKLQRAPERGGGGDKVLGPPRGEAQAEVCLPDLRVEHEHALERRAHLVEAGGLSGQRRSSGALEVGLEIGAIEAEPETARLRERVRVCASRR